MKFSKYYEISAELVFKELSFIRKTTKAWKIDATKEWAAPEGDEPPTFLHRIFFYKKGTGKEIEEKKSAVIPFIA